ncbi:hypothetical protein CGRA01v4_06262 [Colletotrichum graminicola]|uniref:Uncharacterized protein n=1 Tax=Colletotrichum graminicola (strain M1.001 / M2 / FGSC 10212) TaxID=645133 RepID=E3QWY8_COLGM|nr:uncharacterized protein GLRG_10520 [Colletotrichum graminicola M1.001]EFQ35376.1 hypothetical protein GLRG_10520 [Colletotrichum graminicola M1.001]WDK14981.1 hypothetical protein CGRA01v4_06262 [Colletotrichum graminicola]
MPRPSLARTINKGDGISSQSYYSSPYYAQGDGFVSLSMGTLGTRDINATYCISACLQMSARIRPPVAVRQ